MNIPLKTMDKNKRVSSNRCSNIVFSSLSYCPKKVLLFWEILTTTTPVSDYSPYCLLSSPHAVIIVRGLTRVASRAVTIIAVIIKPLRYCCRRSNPARDGSADGNPCRSRRDSCENGASRSNPAPYDHNWFFPIKSIGGLYERGLCVQE